MKATPKFLTTHVVQTARETKGLSNRKFEEVQFVITMRSSGDTSKVDNKEIVAQLLEVSTNHP